MNLLIAARGYNYINDNTVGRFELGQAAALREYGHDVRIISLDLRSVRRIRKWGQIHFLLERIPVFSFSYPIHGLGSRVEDRTGRYGARKAYAAATADGWKPDVIHAHFTEMGYYVADVASTYHVPLVITEHSSRMNQEMIDPLTHKRAMYAYKNAAQVIAVGRGLAEHIRLYTGVSASVVPNLLDLNVFDPSFYPREREDGDFHFVTAGGLQTNKNIDGLLEAFTALPMKQTKLTVFGDGPLRKKLKRQAQTLGIQTRVVFRGNCTAKELAAEYARSDCFVLPSHSETFGVAYIEAMAMGLPVVATSCGGPEDFVTPEVGMLIPKDDVTAFSKAMEIMTKTARDYDSETVRNYVLEHFSPKVVTTRLTEIYRNLL